MTDHSHYYFPAPAGYGLFLLLRALWRLLDRPPTQRNPDPLPSVRPIVTSPPKAAPLLKPAPPPTPAPQRPLPPPLVSPPTRPVPHAPVVQWTAKGELVAWRFWRLCRWYGDGKIRLASVAARWAWDGPVFRAHAVPQRDDAVGLYALRGLPPARNSRLWGSAIHVVGYVALSGRVVEHEHGFRAERATIRRLRLTVGTHLELAQDAEVHQLVRALEDRYQAPVRPGWRDRPFARDLVTRGLLTQHYPMRRVSPAEGWQLG